jgi:hypothetical protein
MNRVLEIRTYTLKPGTREQFHSFVMEFSLPMLKRWGVDVVLVGPSLHDDVSYVLMRSYADLRDRQESQDAFYGSDEWKNGPREPILALIETFTSVVLPVTPEALNAYRTPI